MNLSIIIFCYNERDNLGRVIESSIALAEKLCESYEIIVVDDGSTDGSEIVPRSYPAVRYIRHEKNEGIGVALRTGYQAAALEYVCAVPGDGQFDLYELSIIKPFDRKQFYSFYRPSTDYNIYRTALSKANKVFNRIILGINLRDVNWIKVYRKDQLELVKPELRSSIVESEICCKLIKSGCTPVEAPSVYHPRKTGTAKGGSPRTLIKAIKEIVSLYIVTKRFKAQNTKT